MADEERSLPYVVEVTAELPYYVPIPEGTALAPSLIGAEPFQLEFQHFKPLRHPEDSHGEGVDDRRGTYLRSKARVVFPVPWLPPDEKRQDYERKALAIVNRALLSVRYVAFDPTIIHVNEFENCIVRLWERKPGGQVIPAGTWAQKVSYGPFGITPQATLTSEALSRVWWIFNELAPTNPACLLVLDAKYHSAVGDVSRAILDLATALEINIESLVNLYSSVSSSLLQLDLDVSVYKLYDAVLSQATGHSLHEKPDLYAELEYIRELRNSIAHRWKPQFQVTAKMKDRSRYLAQHTPRDGHVISSSEELDPLIDHTQEIIKFSIDAFVAKYGKL